MDIVISSGHGKYVRGASGYIDEVDEARRVVDRVAQLLRSIDVGVEVFHDDVSTSQDENLRRIVDHHNAQSRDLDISVHFNAYEDTDREMGTEVLYVTQDELAGDVSNAISRAGALYDRGAKYRGDLYFLNNTEEPAILIETCFCDSSADSELYMRHFDEICQAIVETITGRVIEGLPPLEPPEPEQPPLTGENRVDIVGAVRGNVTIIVNGQVVRQSAERGMDAVSLQITAVGDVMVTINGQDFHNPKPLASFIGKCSWFGGPEDTGVSPDEGLAFIYDYDEAPHLFLDEQPSGTTGLARRLDPSVYYVACRWDYEVTPKDMLANKSLMAKVTSKRTGKSHMAWPADWGPHEDTDRVADLSPGLLERLGLTTDDDVEVVYPS